MFQPDPGKDYICPVFTINGQTLPTVDKFTFLGSKYIDTIQKNVSDGQTDKFAKTTLRSACTACCDARQSVQTMV